MNMLQTLRLSLSAREARHLRYACGVLRLDPGELHRKGFGSRLARWVDFIGVAVAGGEGGRAPRARPQDLARVSDHDHDALAGRRQSVRHRNHQAAVSGAVFVQAGHRPRLIVQDDRLEGDAERFDGPDQLGQVFFVARQRDAIDGIDRNVVSVG